MKYFKIHKASPTVNTKAIAVPDLLCYNKVSY